MTQTYKERDRETGRDRLAEDLSIKDQSRVLILQPTETEEEPGEEREDSRGEEGRQEQTGQETEEKKDREETVNVAHRRTIIVYQNEELPFSLSLMPTCERTYTNRGTS